MSSQSRLWMSSQMPPLDVFSRCRLESTGKPLQMSSHVCCPQMYSGKLALQMSSGLPPLDVFTQVCRIQMSSPCLHRCRIQMSSGKLVFRCHQVCRLRMSSGKPPLDVFTDAAFGCLHRCRLWMSSHVSRPQMSSHVSRLWMSSQMPHSDVFR